MNAAEAARAISHRRWQRNFILPCYTPTRWWECDIFELTKAGYFREYEIKMTRADFFADAKKERPFRDGGISTTATKHASMGTTNGPSRFWFVVPEAMIALNEVPSFAGLIELHTSPRGKISEIERVVAPTLHREKIDPKVESHARATCYWRMHRLLLKRKDGFDADCQNDTR
jgi:hypothetical protein